LFASPVGGRRGVPPDFARRRGHARPPEGRDLWTKVSADEQTEQCGWLKNKYGLSRQIVPSVLPEMMNSKEPGKTRSRFRSPDENEEARYRGAKARL
jgi:hypothetical protein